VRQKESVRVCCVVTVFGSLTNKLVRNAVRERERGRVCVKARESACVLCDYRLGQLDEQAGEDSCVCVREREEECV